MRWLKSITMRIAKLQKVVLKFRAPPVRQHDLLAFADPSGSWGHLRHAKVVPCFLLYVRQTWPKGFPFGKGSKCGHTSLKQWIKMLLDGGSQQQLHSMHHPAMCFREPFCPDASTELMAPLRQSCSCRAHPNCTMKLWLWHGWAQPGSSQPWLTAQDLPRIPVNFSPILVQLMLFVVPKVAT